MLQFRFYQGTHGICPAVCGASLIFYAAMWKDDIHDYTFSLCPVYLFLQEVLTDLFSDYPCDGDNRILHLPL